MTNAESGQMRAVIFRDVVWKDPPDISVNSWRCLCKAFTCMFIKCLSDGVRLICALISILNKFIVHVMIDGNCEGVCCSIQQSLHGVAMICTDKRSDKTHAIYNLFCSFLTQ